MTDSKKQSRRGGRTERNTKAVAQVVLDELAAGNFDLNLPLIAKKAGINLSTLYRRWPSKADLISEAIPLHTRNVKLVDTGSWEKDLQKLIPELVKFLSNPVELAINQALMTSPSESLELNTIASWAPLFELFSDPIKKAQTRGEISDDYEASTLLSLMISPILLSGLFTKKSLSKAETQELVDIFISLTVKKP